ncbi:hypothetical protein P9112_010084 [Eukaryota sp. TZLM1-RC]
MADIIVADFVALCQMVLSSQERKALNVSPPNLIFGFDTSPPRLTSRSLRSPYAVLRILSSSSLLVRNPVSGSTFKTAIHLVKPCLSSLPPEILNAYVAADPGELILDVNVDISADSATVLWSDGTTTVQPVDSTRNTAA